jgi:hypothetical protein
MRAKFPAEYVFTQATFPPELMLALVLVIVIKRNERNHERQWACMKSSHQWLSSRSEHEHEHE